MAENRFRISKGRWLLILGILLVVVDQVIKLLVKSNMTLGEHFSVFGNWFQILFIENEGMAFGMKFGGMVGKFVPRGSLRISVLVDNPPRAAWTAG